MSFPGKKGLSQILNITIIYHRAKYQKNDKVTVRKDRQAVVIS